MQKRGWTWALATACALALARPTAADEPEPSTGAEPGDEAATAAAPDAPGELAADAGALSEEELEELRVAAFEKTLGFQQGNIALGEGLAKLDLGQSFRYLGAEDAEKVLVAWGNPPGSETLGMVMPADLSPFSDDGWAVILSYEEEGHVEDDDAEDIDYDELLSSMQKDTEDSNAERAKAGYGEVHLVGWAEPPHYDSAAKKLYWAKELDFGEGQHTLNYAVRVLGRKGVLELNAVAALPQLAMIKPAMDQVMGRVEFEQGNRYADFDPDMDDVAAYGIGALIAGKVAAKAGLFKGLIALLIASKKLVVVGVLAVLAAIKGLFSRKSESA